LVYGEVTVRRRPGDGDGEHRSGDLVAHSAPACHLDPQCGRVHAVAVALAYPKYDSNLNNGQQMYVAGDTLPVVNTVYVNSVNPSRIILPLWAASPGVGELAGNRRLHVFPNPAAEYISVTCPPAEQAGEIELEVRNPAGMLVIKTSAYCGPAGVELDVHSLPAGLYFLQVRTNSGRLYYAKTAITHP
jgi:hypothetical protein